MKCLPRPTVFLAIALSLLLVMALQAGNPKNSDWKQPTWKTPNHQFDVIKAVDAAAGTLTIVHTGGKIPVERNLKVDTFTEILVADKKATLASVKVGMHVDYTLGGSGTTLARLATVEPPVPPPTPVPTATPSFPKGTQR